MGKRGKLWRKVLIVNRYKGIVRLMRLRLMDSGQKLVVMLANQFQNFLYKS